MDRPELIWKPTGERLVWNEALRRYASRDGRLWSEVYTHRRHIACARLREGQEWRTYHAYGPDPHAALDALADRLREQHTALSAVLGVRSAEDSQDLTAAHMVGYRKGAEEGEPPEKHLATRYHEGCLCRWCKVKRAGAEEERARGTYADGWRARGVVELESRAAWEAALVAEAEARGAEKMQVWVLAEIRRIASNHEATWREHPRADTARESQAVYQTLEIVADRIERGGHGA